jgi:hypothetical protein
VHPADVLVGDLPLRLDLVPEAFNCPLIGRVLRTDELEGHFLFDLLVEGPIHPANAPGPQLLDDLVAAGEQGSPRELIGSRLEGSGVGYHPNRNYKIRIVDTYDDNAYYILGANK